MPISKAHLATAAVAIAAFAAVTFLQRNVFKVPVVGDYLPN